MDNNECIQKTRQTNIEILRILAMIFILISHYSGSCLVAIGNELNSLNTIFLGVLSTLGKYGVQIFFLITGYFMISSKTNIKKVLKLYLQTALYLYLILGLFLIFAPHLLTKTMILRSLLPLGGYVYWFVTVYLILYILIPWLNLIAKTLTKNQYKIMLFTMLFFWFVMSTISDARYCSNELLCAITIYYLGGYIKLYNIQFFANKLKNYLYILLYLIIIITWVSFVVYTNNSTRENIIYLSRLSSIFMLIASCAMFCIFKDSNVKYNKFINSVASSVLAVYLITHNICVRDLIWIKWFKGGDLINNSNLNVYHICENLLFAIIISFIISIIIDKIRIKFIEKPLLNIVNKIFTKIDKNNIVTKVL